MLNAVPPAALTRLSSRGAVETYVTQGFSAPEGGFTFTCDRDVLRVRTVPGA